jgi:hypothetical protein
MCVSFVFILLVLCALAPCYCQRAVLVSVSRGLILLYRCNAVPRGASTQQVDKYSVPTLHTTIICVSSYCWICGAAGCVLILCVCPHTTCSIRGISVLVLLYI